MEVRIYSLRDVKSGYYMSPMYSPNDGSAMRDIFTNLSVPLLRNVKLYPEDFRLCRIGEFDDQTGVIKACEVVVVSEVRTIIEAYSRDKEDE